MVRVCFSPSDVLVLEPVFVSFAFAALPAHPVRDEIRSVTTIDKLNTFLILFIAFISFLLVLFDLFFTSTIILLIIFVVKYTGFIYLYKSFL